MTSVRLTSRDTRARHTHMLLRCTLLCALIALGAGYEPTRLCARVPPRTAACNTVLPRAAALLSLPNDPLPVNATANVAEDGGLKPSEADSFVAYLLPYAGLVLLAFALASAAFALLVLGS